MLDTLKSLAVSRKAWIALVAVIGVMVLTGLGKVSDKDALDFLWKVVVAWIGGIALEDAAANHGAAGGVEGSNNPP